MQSKQQTTEINSKPSDYSSFRSQSVAWNKILEFLQTLVHMQNNIFEQHYLCNKQFDVTVLLLLFYSFIVNKHFAVITNNIINKKLMFL